MTNQLLTISEFIEAARKQGASFEGGDAKVHLAYLTKLGLLPSAIKKKINGEIQGCYPKDSINKLLEIQSMKNSGITYSQISRVPSVVEGPSKLIAITEPLASVGINLQIKPSNFAYLVLGLVIGVLVSTLNTSGLAAINGQNNLPLGQSVSIDNTNQKYSNLDKLDKTNINYLIRN